MSDELLTSTKVREIVERELSGMPKDVATRARRYLVEPFLTVRPWSYGPELFECWVVLADPEKSASGIAFCGGGVWQPHRKWIFLWVDVEAGYDHLGQDSGWFDSLAEAFSESFMSDDPA